MARVVFGMASSRSPLTACGPEFWGQIGERDKQSRRLRRVDGSPITYEQLLAEASPDMAAQCTPEVFAQKHLAMSKAFQTVVERLAAADPDVVVMMGDDEEEYIHDDLRPAIAIYRGATWENIPRATNQADPIAVASNWQWGREQATFPMAPEISTHVLKHLIDAEFDVGDTLTLKAMAHGFGFVYERLLTKRVVPMVPIIINVHTPPAQPTARRCYTFGRAVRAAIEAWPEDLRVAVIGTGGLSVGVLEEQVDRTLLAALKARDVTAISQTPRGWAQGSTGEALCWIATAGALEHLPMDVVDYIPAYRSPAGTGSGLAFATWG